MMSYRGARAGQTAMIDRSRFQESIDHRSWRYNSPTSRLTAETVYHPEILLSMKRVVFVKSRSVQQGRTTGGRACLAESLQTSAAAEVRTSEQAGTMSECDARLRKGQNWYAQDHVVAVRCCPCATAASASLPNVAYLYFALSNCVQLEHKPSPAAHSLLSPIVIALVELLSQSPALTSREARLRQIPPSAPCRPICLRPRSL